MPKNRIIKLSDGRYQYQVTDAAGERHTIKSWKKETQKVFSLPCDELDRMADSLAIGEIKLFDDLVNSWIDHHLSLFVSEGEKELTINIYKRFTQPFLGRKRLDEITKPLVYRVLSKGYESVEDGASRAYVARMRGTITRPYNWAINSLGLNLTNPTIGLVFKVPDKPTRRRIISIEDWQRIQESGEYSNTCFISKLFI